jgi:predicted O-methyltransferase YrrM
MSNEYSAPPAGPDGAPAAAGPPGLRPRPILRRVRDLEGWLEPEEAELLLGTAALAVGRCPAGEEAALVEVGSYCGKSTVLLGLVVQGLAPAAARVYAIDPHEGEVSAHHDERGRVRLPPTWERFRRNLRAAGVEPVVAPIKARSYEVAWGTPIALLFLDGLHDYPNVARDFAHFAGWLRPGGLVAFHDYVDDFPGVQRFVDELLRADGPAGFRLVRRVESLVVLEKV